MFMRYFAYISLIFLQFCAYQSSTNDLKSDTDLYSQIEILADLIENKLDGNSINKIAVMNYTNTSNSGLGSYISDEITLQLFLKEKFQIIERDQLDYVISEQKLGSSGLIDDNSIINIGNILSADAIIIGDVSIVDEKALINIIKKYFYYYFISTLQLRIANASLGSFKKASRILLPVLGTIDLPTRTV